MVKGTGLPERYITNYLIKPGERVGSVICTGKAKSRKKYEYVDLGPLPVGWFWDRDREGELVAVSDKVSAHGGATYIYVRMKPTHAEWTGIAYVADAQRQSRIHQVSWSELTPGSFSLASTVRITGNPENVAIVASKLTYDVESRRSRAYAK